MTLSDIHMSFQVRFIIGAYIQLSTDRHRLAWCFRDRHLSRLLKRKMKTVMREMMAAAVADYVGCFSSFSVVCCWKRCTNDYWWWLFRIRSCHLHEEAIISLEQRRNWEDTRLPVLYTDQSTQSPSKSLRDRPGFRPLCQPEYAHSIRVCPAAYAIYNCTWTWIAVQQILLMESCIAWKWDIQ